MPPATSAGVSGRVTNDQGQPLTDVRVDALGTNGQIVSVRTNATGQYSFVVPAGQRVVTFSNCGFTTSSRIVVVSATPQTLDATLPVRSGELPPPRPFLL